MTPQEMAAIHAAAFHADRPWSAQEFTTLLAGTHVHTQTAAHGFALSRMIADETELLTLAVHPDHQRKGMAQDLMIRWLAHAQDLGALSAYLEVAADNIAACALYESCDFTKISVRPAYYKRINAPAADALILKRALAPA